MASKTKSGSRKRSAPSEEVDDVPNETAPKTKKAKASTASKSKQTNSTSDLNRSRQTDDDGNDFWELSRTKRVQISEFKGITMVGIREFYEKDGKWLPGKKGISLTTEQFNAVVEALPQIEASLKGKDIDMPRPDYSAVIPAAATKDEDDDEDDDEEEEEADEAENDDEEDVKPPIAKKGAAKKKKPNHEETSDEED
ncbi:hypothetical protein B0A48_14550 [Cryoendolithus antarcticus]|uniref:Transcriptional coactivator p15 (PC4) C-terminal domain-containing protein n=1 Tax=Cryoendolithus antarcticus TaxID=1507870 RepID=A0A1V8SLG3_9PEZI|nr:hypothetical protein B0A48_14550 [Cryoendolithus antarcticus]